MSAWVRLYRNKRLVFFGDRGSRNFRPLSRLDAGLTLFLKARPPSQKSEICVIFLEAFTKNLYIPMCHPLYKFIFICYNGIVNGLIPFANTVKEIHYV